MEQKNLSTEIIRTIFFTISFVAYVAATISNNTFLTSLSVFIYVVPQLLNVIDDFMSKHLLPQMVKLDIISMTLGAIIAVATILCLMFKLKLHLILRIILAIMSVPFLIRSAYQTINEVQKYYNVHMELVGGVKK